MNVKELLESKKIDFSPQGKDYVVRCLNPEHDDNNPSMKIDNITGIFGCFSCGYKGNIFSLFGVAKNTLEIKKQKLKQKILEKLTENIGLNLPNNITAYEGTWRDISVETYKKFEAFESIEPTYSGRIVFPVKSLAGKIVGFNARALTPDKQPKYIIHPPGARLPLYPQPVKPIQGRVILVEGLYDMLNLHDKGLTNAVCCFGTQKINTNKLNLLKVQGVSGIDILFDTDDAGREGAVKAKELAEKCDLVVNIIDLKTKKDAGELTAFEVLRLKEKLYENSTSGDEAE